MVRITASLEYCILGSTCWGELWSRSEECGEHQHQVHLCAGHQHQVHLCYGHQHQVHLCCGHHQTGEQDCRILQTNIGGSLHSDEIRFCFPCAFATRDTMLWSDQPCWSSPPTQLPHRPHKHNLYACGFTHTPWNERCWKIYCSLGEPPAFLFCWGHGFHDRTAFVTDTPPSREKYWSEKILNRAKPNLFMSCVNFRNCEGTCPPFAWPSSPLRNPT